MDPKMLPVFVSLAFCCLTGAVLSQAPLIYLDCSVVSGRDGATVSELDCGATSGQDGATMTCCSSKYGGEVIVTADSLRQLNVSHPITSLRIEKRGGITIMENALKELRKLSSLQLEGYSYNITIPSEEFKNTPDLRALDIRRGAITGTTVQAIRSAAKLEQVVIFETTGWKLKADSLRGLDKLKTVEFMDNGFSAIEEGTFDGLPELMKLRLNGYSISSITAVLPKDSNELKTIHFHNNNIRSIPKGAFEKYKQLVELTLTWNPITVLEDGIFEGLQNLRYLYLYWCPIYQLPESDLHKMKNLEILSLHGTKISQINSTTFKGLRKLRELDLGDCKELTTIEPGSFDDLVSVTSLHLNGNPSLRNLPDGLFENMKMLRHVDLQGTCVENLSRANFTNGPSLSMLYFGNCAASG